MSEELTLEYKEAPSPKFKALRSFARHKLGLFGIVVLVAFILTALLAPVIVPNDPYTMKLEEPFLPLGSPGHPLGTDNFGRDMLSRLVYGARISLLIGVVVVSVAAVLGTVLGLMAGYYGGWADFVIMRMVEVFYSFPFLILVIAVMAILGPSIFNVMWVLGVVSWPSYARVVRAQVLSLKSSDFVSAARATGCGDSRIIFKHILPNTMTPIIVQATLGIPNAILSSASLGFLGFGVQPPTPEWGSMVSQGKDYIMMNSNLIILPGLCIFVVVLCFNFIGDALRDTLDPRLARELK
ncbi:MAG: ABC transporter permease [Firmicutes bacterium]|nr:ABC transporter permease [Bacillota bacterium]